MYAAAAFGAALYSAEVRRQPRGAAIYVARSCIDARDAAQAAVFLASIRCLDLCGIEFWTDWPWVRELQEPWAEVHPADPDGNFPTARRGAVNLADEPAAPVDVAAHHSRSVR